MEGHFLNILIAVLVFYIENRHTTRISCSYFFFLNVAVEFGMTNPSFLLRLDSQFIIIMTGLILPHDGFN